MDSVCKLINCNNQLMKQTEGQWIFINNYENGSRTMHHLTESTETQCVSEHFLNIKIYFYVSQGIEV